MSEACETPVALIVFNRPEPTRRLMETLRIVRPTQLFLIADGPRPDRVGERQLCDEVRAIASQVDWPCRVERSFADTNLGCRENVNRGLTWLFQKVEAAIILEDDCHPSPSFFPFCTELLGRYREDPRVGAISGDNFLFGRQTTDASYYFSSYCHIWGWATWRRAWEAFDPLMPDWQKLRRANWLAKNAAHGREAHYWKLLFDDSWKRPRDGMNTWDIAWQFHCRKSGLLTAIPAVNLVTNVGFGEDSTHTSGKSRMSALNAGELTFPLKHPATVQVSTAADLAVDQNVFSGVRPMSWLCRARLPLPIHWLRRARRICGG